MTYKFLPHPHENDIELNDVLGAISDPVRRKVLEYISIEGPQYCGQMDFNLSKSTMSHHFRVLREAGLIQTIIKGKHHQIWRRDSAIEKRFPGLLGAVGLQPGKGQWDEKETNQIK